MASGTIPNRPLLIAISGCSSSGKTTLSHILSAALPSYALTIRQDDFFIDKSDCPLISFVQPGASGDDDGSPQPSLSSSASERCKLVTGPHTDCRAAIDFVDFESTLRSVAGGGGVPAGSAAGSKPRALGNTDESLQAFGSKNLATLKRDIRGFVDKEHNLNREAEFCGENVRSVGTSIDAGAVAVLRPIVLVEGILMLLEDGSATSEAQGLLRDDLDGMIKLMLPISRAVAERRRFERAEYQDPPRGTRQPGETWKLEGYFNDAVWSSYVLEHQWIFGEDIRENGGVGIEASDEARRRQIHIRPRDKESLLETAQWAKTVIFEALADREAKGRETFTSVTISGLQE